MWLPVRRAVGVVAAMLAMAAISGAAEGPEARAAAAEQAGRLREAFMLYLDAHRSLPPSAPPGDAIRLRERIVSLARRLDPPPAIPADAERAAVRAQVMFREAHDDIGLKSAEDELAKAVLLAPWFPQATFNLALVQQRRRRYEEGLANMRLYGQAAPDDAEARAKIYELEYQLERQKERLAEYEAGRAPSDARAAFELYEEVCRTGSWRGCVDLGVAHESGMGVTADRARALVLYDDACRHGDTRGCYLLARSLETTDLPRSLAILRQVCAEGHAVACLRLAERSANGIGVPRNEGEAVEFYGKACEANDAEACWELAFRLERGKGVPKDKARALALYDKSCTLGLQGGCYRAGKLR